MSEVKKAIRLSKAAREFNVGLSTIVEFLQKKGFELEMNPNTKVSEEMYDLLLAEYSSELKVKKEVEKLKQSSEDVKETITITDLDRSGEGAGKPSEDELIIKDVTSESLAKTPTELELEKEPAEKKVKVVGKVDLDKEKEKKKETKKEKEEPAAAKEAVKKETGPAAKEKEEKKPAKAKAKKEDKADITEAKKEVKETKKEKEEAAVQEAETVEAEPAPPKEDPVFKSEIQTLSGPTVVGKIDLPVEEPRKKPVASSKDTTAQKKKRKRIQKEKVDVGRKGGKEDRSGQRKRSIHTEVSEEEVQQQIKETLARLTTKTKSKASRYRREKRDSISQRHKEEIEKQAEEIKKLRVTEFVSVSELASMMDVQPTEVIATCMSLGLIVSINQRLDAETMSLVADEFGYEVEFVSADILDTIKVSEEEDNEEDLLPRSPIVTVMGHVDHGKTKLLDYIRSANVVAGEAGGITQHIGAYSVTLENGRQITFLDTPGHEAFTAMRARGAQITDIAIIVIAADDGIMPQTVEAINHAQAAGVQIVFAINKIDKPTANPDKIKEELANMNILVEDWGGKYQSQDISAKQGLNVDELLEKVLLEADLLELKANPNKKANGTVIESSLDKGRGYITTILVKEGTLRIGDLVLAGVQFGRVKAMFNERGQKMTEAGPSSPTLILGLNGAPQAGDQFNVLENDKEAKDIANKRSQLQREQNLRTQKHITLDEIGRRIAIGNFQELNIVVKGDVDGSIEAMSDSLMKLSNEEIQVNIIHKAVGQITESDVLLAAASNAIIVGFQVRPSINARKLAEKEEIDIRLYSIIYDAINEVKSAMEGMLSPEIKEEILGTLEIKETFKITKVGTIAGCIVKEGKILRKNKVRVIRDGIVIYTGDLGSLKRFKDEVKEAYSGQECGLNIANFNDIKVGDMVEAFEEFEVKKTL